MDAYDRNTNLEIIRQLRNLEKDSLDSFIDNVLLPLKEKNPSFLKTLYKDIMFTLNGLDEEGDNDLVIEDGHLVIENGSLKLSGYQTRLHDIVRWLHIETLSENFERYNDMEKILSHIERFQKELREVDHYTPEYKKELEKIKSSLKRERRNNYENEKYWFKDDLTSKLQEVLVLKPNIGGVGVDIKSLIRLIRTRKR
ncbi:MAG: hypothetical protein NXI10_04995 [bacterium]|nr:hypothetical protein [bacterium]